MPRGVLAPLLLGACLSRPPSLVGAMRVQENLSSGAAGAGDALRKTHTTKNVDLSFEKVVQSEPVAAESRANGKQPRGRANAGHSKDAYAAKTHDGAVQAVRPRARARPSETGYGKTARSQPALPPKPRAKGSGGAAGGGSPRDSSPRGRAPRGRPSHQRASAKREEVGEDDLFGKVDSEHQARTKAKREARLEAKLEAEEQMNEEKQKEEREAEDEERKEALKSTEKEKDAKKDEAAEHVKPDPLAWDRVKTILSKHAPISFTAGDAKGQKFKYNSLRTGTAVTPGFSFGKWLAGTAIAGAVNDGKLKWDTLASEVFTWWTKKENDKRSKVTLRHLLTFTSGFVAKPRTLAGAAMQHSHEVVLIGCLNPPIQNVLYSLEQCAKQIYSRSAHRDDPGTTFQYNSMHLQIAFAMACKATGLTASKYFDKYLWKPAEMTKSSFGAGANPMVSGGLVSNLNDIDSFLRKYLAYEIVPKEIVDEMDAEYVQKNKCKVRTSGAIRFSQYQNFAMAHVATRGYKQFDPSLSGFTPMKVTIQEWGGATGWQGYIDRTNNIYMALVVNQQKTYNPVSLAMRDVYAAMGQTFPEKASDGKPRPTPAPGVLGAVKSRLSFKKTR